MIKNHDYYNLFKPSNLMFFSKKTFSLMKYFFYLFLFAGLYLIVFSTPSDNVQGENFKIIFVHVPVAWLSLLLYTSLAINSFIFLINKHPLAHINARISCKLGLFFTFLTLITGSLWGYPTWGTYWVWDARLTSVLILFFLFLSYYVLNLSFLKNDTTSNISSILAVFGILNLPIIKFSVNWWNTLHQSASVSEFGTTIHITMLVPLILFTISFFFLFFYLYIFELRIFLIHNKITSIKNY